jgi:type IV secretory pathway VirB4 component
MSRILRLPAVTLTTRHSPVAYPWQHCQSVPDGGVAIGINAIAGGQLLSYDPWVCYAANVVTSPNMIVAGQLGRGKSALVKTYLRRQLAAGRQAYVLDPKGEYGPLAAATGLARIALRPGGTERLNPLDPPPGSTSRDQIITARTAVVAALAGTGLGRELTGEEHVALTAAVRRLPDETALLGDITDTLLRPSPELATEMSTTPAALATAVRPVALELHRLLSGDLAGMINGPTTARLDPSGPGVVVDLSAVVNTDAQTPVMVCAGAWLAAAVDVETDRRRLLLVDEAWALLTHSATTRWLQQTSKLARARGIALITVIHRLSDLAAQTDAGTATRAQAEGLLADAETRVLYGQAPGERRLATDLLGLTDPEADLVCSLGPYRGLWRIGEHTALVDHVLTAADHTLVDTDARMRT